MLNFNFQTDFAEMLVDVINLNKVNWQAHSLKLWIHSNANKNKNHQLFNYRPRDLLPSLPYL